MFASGVGMVDFRMIFAMKRLGISRVSSDRLRSCETCLARLMPELQGFCILLYIFCMALGDSYTNTKLWDTII